MNLPVPGYYGQPLWPLSPLLNTKEFDGSQLDYLAGISQDAIHIRELSAVYGHVPTAAYAWRVVAVEPVPDDDIMSYFKTYRVAIDNMQIANLVADNSIIGVVNGGKMSITGGMAYRPIDTGGWYLCHKNEFMTQATAGYHAQVIDRHWPSEQLAFGHVQEQHHHQGMIVSFALMPLDSETYPHDYPAVKPQ